MSDETEIARIAAEQRATPEDLKPQPEPSPTAAIEAGSEETEAPEVEATAEDVTEEGAEAETPEPEPAPKKKKTATDFLTGRVGNLQGRLTESETRAAALQARLDAAEALLAAQGRTPAETPETPPAATPAPQRADLNPTTGRVYTEAEFQTAVAQRAEADAFNRQADAVYDLGAQAFPDWKESIDVLNASGIMSKDLLDAALAVGDQKVGAAVIHRLGSDLEEAQRIAALSPVKMGVELAKIAAEVAKPAQQRVSSAPPPIPSIRGNTNPQIDLARIANNDTNDMSAYAAARAKQGDPYALSRADRAALARQAARN